MEWIGMKMNGLEWNGIEKNRIEWTETISCALERIAFSHLETYFSYSECSYPVTH